MTQLTPTARLIWKVAQPVYDKAAGITEPKKESDLSEAQILAFNAIAEWHDEQVALAAFSL